MHSFGLVFFTDHPSFLAVSILLRGCPLLSHSAVGLDGETLRQHLPSHLSKISHRATICCDWMTLVQSRGMVQVVRGVDGKYKYKSDRSSSGSLPFHPPNPSTLLLVDSGRPPPVVELPPEPLLLVCVHPSHRHLFQILNREGGCALQG